MISYKEFEVIRSMLHVPSPKTAQEVYDKMHYHVFSSTQ